MVSSFAPFKFFVFQSKVHLSGILIRYGCIVAVWLNWKKWLLQLFRKDYPMRIAQDSLTGKNFRLLHYWEKEARIFLAFSSGLFLQANQKTCYSGSSPEHDLKYSTVMSPWKYWLIWRIQHLGATTILEYSTLRFINPPDAAEFSFYRDQPYHSILYTTAQFKRTVNEIFIIFVWVGVCICVEWGIKTFCFHPVCTKSKTVFTASWKLFLTSASLTNWLLRSLISDCFKVPPPTREHYFDWQAAKAINLLLFI